MIYVLSIVVTALLIAVTILFAKFIDLKSDVDNNWKTYLSSYSMLKEDLLLKIEKNAVIDEKLNTFMSAKLWIGRSIKPIIKENDETLRLLLKHLQLEKSSTPAQPEIIPLKKLSPKTKK